MADSRVDWPTREILLTPQGAPLWDGELCTSKWSAQPVLSNYDRGAPRMCSGPRALQCHRRLHYDKNYFTSQLGLKFGDHAITDVDFADDLAILVDCMESLQEALRILQEEAAEVGLHINWNKTKIMAIDPSSPIVNSPFSLESTTSIVVARDFTYLGSIISSNGSLLPELQARLSKASFVMVRLNRHIWRKPNISRIMKLRIFNTLVGSVMLYGAETWQASAATLKKCDVFYVKSLRRIEGLLWSDFVSNEKLL